MMMMWCSPKGGIPELFRERVSLTSLVMHRSLCLGMLPNYQDLGSEASRSTKACHRRDRRATQAADMVRRMTTLIRCYAWASANGAHAVVVMRECVDVYEDARWLKDTVGDMDVGIAR